jgi:hypothetical protein
MTSKFAYIKNNLAERIVFSVLFAAGFAIIGFYIPKIYYTYLDHTDYYKIISPIKVNDGITQAIHPCDSVEVHIERNSLIDSRGFAVIALDLVREDMNGNKDRIAFTTRDLPLTSGQGVVISHWQVSCDAKTPGTYFFEGNLSYEVNGVKKEEPFFTDKFKVSALDLQK